MTIAKGFAAKLTVAFVATAMALTLVAPAAQAQTASEIQAQIDQLLAALAALQGGSSSMGCSFTFTDPMGQGTTGAQVLNLQQFLNMNADTQVSVSGAGAPGMETQYYGPATAAAVSKFQVKYRAEILTPLGLVNPTGYFGSSSITKANALCSGGQSGQDDDDDDSSDSGDLEGGAGAIDDAQYITKLSSEEVGEGAEDVEVAGLEIESDGSDIELLAVQLNFSDEGTANNDDDLDEYADEISVWVDGEEVARVDADEFDDDSNYTKTVTLDRGAIIREGDTADLVVAVSGISNLDDASAGDSWSVEFESVRFEDAQGSVITDSSTGDINDGAGRTFTFESFATASDLELKVSKGDEDINDGRSITADDNNDTDNVEILSFEIEIEGDSDVTVEDLAVAFTSDGADIDEIANTAELVVDGDVVGSESIPTAATTTSWITFDNIDLEIEAGDTIEVIVRVDVNNLSGNFGAGDTLSASVDPDNSLWDVEDEEGETVGATDKTGTASSDAHAFYANGMNVELVSTSAVKTAGDASATQSDSGTFTITFDVTAFGSDIYIDNTAPSTLTGVAAVTAHDLTPVPSAATGTLSTQITSPSGATEGTDSFTVEEGETERFQITIDVRDGATDLVDGFFAYSLDGILFSDATDEDGDTVHTSGLDDFETDSLFLDDNE